MAAHNWALPSPKLIFNCVNLAQKSRSESPFWIKSLPLEYDMTNYQFIFLSRLSEIVFCFFNTPWYYTQHQFPDDFSQQTESRGGNALIHFQDDLGVICTFHLRVFERFFLCVPAKLTTRRVETHEEHFVNAVLREWESSKLLKYYMFCYEFLL